MGLSFTFLNTGSYLRVDVCVGIDDAVPFLIASLYLLMTSPISSSVSLDSKNFFFSSNGMSFTIGYINNMLWLNHYTCHNDMTMALTLILGVLRQ